MPRVTFWFNDSDKYMSVQAEEFHEDEGFLKAYNTHNELVAVIDMKYLKGAYISEQREDI